MSMERLQTLADAYGADIARWPERERDAARRLVDADRRAAQVLVQARALADVLDSWAEPPADAALRDRVLASALRPQRRFTARSLRLWFAGAGLAAAVAGVSCGVFLSSSALQEAREDAALAVADRDPGAAIAPFSEPVQSL